MKAKEESNSNFVNYILIIFPFLLVSFTNPQSQETMQTDSEFEDSVGPSCQPKWPSDIPNEEIVFAKAHS